VLIVLKVGALDPTFEKRKALNAPLVSSGCRGTTCRWPSWLCLALTLSDVIVGYAMSITVHLDTFIAMSTTSLHMSAQVIRLKE
jgi:hypothetical protein